MDNLTGDPEPGRRPALDASSLLCEAQDLLSDTISLRRDIHAEPELGLDLPRTQAKVLDALAELDLDVRTGSALSSVVATLTGDAEGPTLLLRADMDALPLPEDTGLEFASVRPGLMHACGHDAHAAMLAGAARLLAGRRRDLRGSVKFLFQPGEEGPGGATICIDEGLLEDPQVDAAFALHISPNIAAGRLATRPGPLMAATDELEIVIVGRGGHASTPHLTADPVPVAAQLVLALQSYVARAVDAFDPVVLTVARITAGTASNVIPERVEMEGTLRTVSDRTRARVVDDVARVATHVAAAHDCRAEVTIRPGYPVTVNDAVFVSFTRDVLHQLVGPEQVIDLRNPVLGAEDWSYVLQRVPGCMAFLGVCPPELDARSAPSCHSNRMLLDEDSLAVGVAAHAAMALSYLA
jgi:amidohydrolase